MANNIKIENEQVVGQTYSTSEKWTGDYWIDGKKIYRKVFRENYTASGSLLICSIDVASLHISEVVLSHFMNRQQVNGNIELGPWGTSATDYGRLLLLSNKTVLQPTLSSVFSTADEFTIILEYTKTTED